MTRIVPRIPLHYPLDPATNAPDKRASLLQRLAHGRLRSPLAVKKSTTSAPRQEAPQSVLDNVLLNTGHFEFIRDLSAHDLARMGLAIPPLLDYLPTVTRNNHAGNPSAIDLGNQVRAKLVSNEPAQVAWMLGRLGEWTRAQPSYAAESAVVDALMRCPGFAPIVVPQTSAEDGSTGFQVPGPLDGAMNSSEPDARYLAREVLSKFLREVVRCDNPERRLEQYLTQRGYPPGEIRLAAPTPGAEPEIQVPQQYDRWLLEGSPRSRRDNLSALLQEITFDRHDLDATGTVASDLAEFLRRTAGGTADAATQIDILATAFETVYDLHPNGAWTGATSFDLLLSQLRHHFGAEFLVPAMVRAAGTVVMNNDHLADACDGLDEHLLADDVTDTQFQNRLAQIRGDLPAALNARELKPAIGNRFKRKLFERIKRLPRDAAAIERRETLAAFEDYDTRQAKRLQTRREKLRELAGGP
jgi:hypothetical protein